MSTYFSPSTNGFYIDGINDNIPSDKILITEEERKELIGKEIGLGPSGKPEIKPSHYHTLNQAGGAWEITAENQVLKDAGEEEVTRKADIQTARDNSGFKKVTAQKAYDFIDGKLDGASNAAEVKEAIRDILKKMIPHILD